jgi:ankyrin repeat protein
LNYRLLSYVVDNWAFHTMKLSRRDPQLWDSFKAVVLDRKLPFTFRPWEGNSAPGGSLYLQHFLWAVAVGHTPLLQILSEPSRLSIFQEYCVLESEDGKLAFLSAAEQGHQDAAELLLSATKFSSTQQKHTQLGMAVKLAIKSGNPALLQLVLREAIDINEQGEAGRTHLHHAAHGGQEAIVRLLLERGANVNARDDEGWTALHFAAGGGHEAAVKYLVYHGAYVEAADKTGLRALHLAAHSGHEKTARVLADCGAEIEAMDKHCPTALHIAAHRGHETTARLLVELGANLERKMDHGWTALHLAAGGGQEAVVNLLADSGGDMDALTTCQWTARSLSDAGSARTS